MPWALVLQRMPPRSVESEGRSVTSRRSSTRTTSGAEFDRGGEGAPGTPVAAQGRQVAQVVEPLAVVEELLVVAALDAGRVGPIEQAAGEAGAQPRRPRPDEAVREQPARQDREGREQCRRVIRS